jgi:hypothetical protein
MQQLKLDLENALKFPSPNTVEGLDGSDELQALASSAALFPEVDQDGAYKYSDLGSRNTDAESDLRTLVGDMNCT